MDLKGYFTIIFCLALSVLQAQEICNNAIDDDNDGLIDLNDDDCQCEAFIPSSLIPNPSFEEMSCCPTNEAMLNCADTWIQASVPTTDYVHTCGILGLPFINAEAPQPFPDGEGAVGFRDGKPGAPNFKEYTGACLMEPLKSGTKYMLDFYVGFRSEVGSSNLDMAVYAAMDCNQLPFDQTDQEFGCPLGNSNYELLGEMSYSGTNEWVNAVFEFTPSQDFNVIVLGPACDVNPNVDLDPYYFFDRLILAEEANFGIPIVDITGNPCEGTVSVISSDKIDGTYQWYKDGIAIIGATSATLDIPEGPDREGTYQMVVTTDTGCLLGDEYVLEIDSFSSEIEASICASDSIIIDGQVIQEAGEYVFMLTTDTGCDSTVTLNLDVLNEDLTTLETTLCPGESVIVSGEVYTSTGTFTQAYQNESGCDSLVQISIFNEPGCNDCEDINPGLISSFNIHKLTDDQFKLKVQNNQPLILNETEMISTLALLLSAKAEEKVGLQFLSMSLSEKLSSDLIQEQIIDMPSSNRHYKKASDMIRQIQPSRSLNYQLRH